MFSMNFYFSFLGIFSISVVIAKNIFVIFFFECLGIFVSRTSRVFLAPF